MNEKFEDFKRKVDFEEKKRKAKEGLCTFGKVLWENKGTIAGAIIIGTGAAKTLNKVANDAHERKLRDRSTYDNRTSTWYETKKPLTNRQKLEVQDLMKSGMTKGEALRELGLLKR